MHSTSADQLLSLLDVVRPPRTIPATHTPYHCWWSGTLYKIVFPLFSTIVGHPELSTSVFSSKPRSIVSLCGCADFSTSPLRISPSDYTLSGLNITTRPGTVREGSISISPQKRYQYTHPATTFSRSSHSLMWPSSLHPQTYVLQSLCMTYLSKTVCSGPPCLAFPQSGSHRRQGRRVKREIRKKRFVLKVQAFINQSNTI